MALILNHLRGQILGGAAEGVSLDGLVAPIP